MLCIFYCYSCKQYFPGAGLPFPGVLLLTLGSLWYWELQGDTQVLTPSSAPTYNLLLQVQHRLATPPGRVFNSLSYHPSSRLLLASCRPAPLALHLVMQLSTTRLASGARTVTGQVGPTLRKLFICLSFGHVYQEIVFKEKSLGKGPKIKKRKSIVFDHRRQGPLKVVLQV